MGPKSTFKNSFKQAVDPFIGLLDELIHAAAEHVQGYLSGALSTFLTQIRCKGQNNESAVNIAFFSISVHLFCWQQDTSSSHKETLESIWKGLVMSPFKHFGQRH